MANIASQKKRILRAERERLENRRHTSAIKTYFRRLERRGRGRRASWSPRAPHAGPLDRQGDQDGALHRNTGARKKSRAARILSSSKS